MERLYVRGRNNVHKKLLMQAAACNLALLMRALYGTGKPRATHDRRAELILAILWLHSVLTELCESERAQRGDPDSSPHHPRSRHEEFSVPRKTAV
jgi:hypothetical protein